MRRDGQNQLQISAPLPLKETTRMTPLSAQPISLDSPFNGGLTLRGGERKALGRPVKSLRYKGSLGKDPY
jgi:hypothetical protein